MGANSKIEWTHHTFSPWWGCVEVSPACDHCYARAFAKRCGSDVWGVDAQRRFTGDKQWAEPLKWDRAAAEAGERHRVFCGSMCDVMEDYNGAGHLIRETIEESRRWLYSLIERTPNLDWLLLTKQPQNLRRFLPPAWLENPRPNVWGMTTVESAEYLWRVDALIETPFAMRGISAEPLLGPIRFKNGHLADRCDTGGNFWQSAGGVHWVIAGGESGRGRRTPEIEWFGDLRRQCLRAGVAFFMKQDSAFRSGEQGRIPPELWAVKEFPRIARQKRK